MYSVEGVDRKEFMDGWNLKGDHWVIGRYWKYRQETCNVGIAQEVEWNEEGGGGRGGLGFICDVCV
jgi:hypothetical protein